MLKKALPLVVIVAVVVAIPIARSVLRGAGGAEVEVEALEARTIRTSVLASGNLAHENEVELMSEEIGTVTEIHVKEGDKVERGQLLLGIDDETLRAAAEQTAAQVRMQEIAIQRQEVKLENLRAQWERQRSMHERGLLDDDTFGLTTNELALAEIDLRSSREQLSQGRAQLQQSEERLSKTRIYAPINGKVTSLDIEVGETAISSSTNIRGSSLMTIADPDSILTEVNVDEADIANVEVGQRANVYPIAYPDTPVPGVIESIAVSAKVPEGAQGRSFAVKIRLEDADVVLRPGMSCRAEIFTTSKDGVLAVPIQAIQIEEDPVLDRATYYVFVHRNGVARRVEVETGISDDTYQEIIGDISEGDEIIVGPDRALRDLGDGAAVTVAGSGDA